MTLSRNSFVACVAFASLLLSCRRPPDAPNPGPEWSVLPFDAARVRWERIELPPVVRAGSPCKVRVTLRNDSSFLWPNPGSNGRPPGGAGAVRLAYRWLSASHDDDQGDYSDRTDLPRELRPGESITLSVDVMPPRKRGDYHLQFDLVQELAFWFESKGADRNAVAVRVE
jgi:hypothetical protein